jgi:mRNA-degrading endonuclease RelE of RelBE toxin-antitoxin system
MLEVKFSNLSLKFIKKNKDKSPELIRLIYKEVTNLQKEPKRVNSKKIVGHDYYRIRIGNYRVVYKFTKVTLAIVAIGKRDNIYTKL